MKKYEFLWTHGKMVLSPLHSQCGKQNGDPITWATRDVRFRFSQSLKC